VHQPAAIETFKTLPFSQSPRTETPATQLRRSLIFPPHIAHTFSQSSLCSGGSSSKALICPGQSLPDESLPPTTKRKASSRVSSPRTTSSRESVANPSASKYSVKISEYKTTNNDAIQQWNLLFSSHETMNESEVAKRTCALFCSLQMRRKKSSRHSRFVSSSGVFLHFFSLLTSSAF